MKICFASHSANMGGAEKALLELIDLLLPLGIHCHVILPEGGPLKCELELRGSSTHIIRYRWWMGPPLPFWRKFVRSIANVGALITLVAHLKTQDCDAVYTNTLTFSTAAFAAWLLRIPHLWSIHELNYKEHNLAFVWGDRLSLYLVDKLSSAIIVNSQTVMAKYCEILTPNKLHLAYLEVPVDENILSSLTEPFSKSPQAVHCVIVGALYEGKRQEDAIRAVGLLRDEGLAISLKIVGAGEATYEQYLYRLVNELRLNDHVNFTGQVDNPQALIADADVVLVCSKSESFGRVAVEAMKLKRPVIASRGGATPELIRDGLNGLLYTPADPIELAATIRRLHTNRKLARQMGKNGHLWTRDTFTGERYIAAVLDALSKVGLTPPVSSERLTPEIPTK